MFQIVAYGPTVYRTGEFALILSDEMVNKWDFLKIRNLIDMYSKTNAMHRLP